MTAPTVTLLCLPCAGASATMYLRWRRALPAWLRVVPVELPGRGERYAHAHATDLDTLAAQLCDRHDADLQGRFVLFGHSMGALLAYRMASWLRRQGRHLPALLIASASPAPALRDPARFDGLDHDDALIADMRKQGGTPEAVYADAELLRLALDTLAADYRLCKSHCYTAQPPLPLPIAVFAGREDDITPAQVTGWRAETSRGCTETWFDGGHFFIRHQEPAVLAALRDVLAGLNCNASRHASAQPA